MLNPVLLFICCCNLLQNIHPSLTLSGVLMFVYIKSDTKPVSLFTILFIRSDPVLPFILNRKKSVGYLAIENNSQYKRPIPCIPQKHSHRKSKWSARLAAISRAIGTWRVRYRIGKTTTKTRCSSAAPPSWLAGPKMGSSLAPPQTDATVFENSELWIMNSE